jgi:hypothetical protein
MLDQLERLEGGPVTGMPGPDREGEELFVPVTAADAAEQDETEHLLSSTVNAQRLAASMEQAKALPPSLAEAFDTFAILNDGSQHFLEGPVPVRPVLFTGPLVQWLSTGACPWGDMDAEHLVLRLANITLEFVVGETLDDGSVVLTPGAHLWTEAAAWSLSSDGTETAVPRG